MEWTKAQPTQPGFYFVEESVGTIQNATIHRVMVWERDHAGRFHHAGRELRLDATLRFAGPIPLPVQPSCYDCEFCAVVGLPGPQHVKGLGHHCSAPLPAWAQGDMNEETPIIEDAGHGATMAERCELFRRRG